MQTRKKKTDVVDIATRAEQALSGLEQELKAIPAAALEPGRLNLRAASMVTLALAQRLREPSRRARFENLARIGEFDILHLNRLDAVALAAWHVYSQRRKSDALGSDALVPAKTLQRANTVRGRMLRVLEFHFDDDDVVGQELRYIRQGTGYQDLADDLLSLSKLYRKHKKVIAGTPKHYDAEDEDTARTLAEEILDTVSGASSDEKWKDLATRVNHMLVLDYNEVRAAAQYLFRNDPDEMEAVPSLVSATRSVKDPVANAENNGEGKDGEKK